MVLVGLCYGSSGIMLWSMVLSGIRLCYGDLMELDYAFINISINTFIALTK